MNMNFVETPSEASIPIRPLRRDELKTWLSDQPESVTRWVVSTGFEAKPGTTCLVPGNDGAIREVLAGAGEALWDWAGLPTVLPAHAYHFAGEIADQQAKPRRTRVGARHLSVRSPQTK